MRTATNRILPDALKNQNNRAPMMNPIVVMICNGLL